MSYPLAWGTMLQKWSLPCHSHLQTLPTQLLVASQQQAPLQGKHPKEKKCGPFSKDWHFTSPLSLIQSPFSSSDLISSLQMCTALPPPHLPMQACHKTFCTSCLLNLAYNQCTNKQPLQSLSALAEDRISRKAVASWKEVKKKNHCRCLLWHRFGNTVVHPFWSILFLVIYSKDLPVQPNTGPWKKLTQPVITES